MLASTSLAIFSARRRRLALATAALASCIGFVRCGFSATPLPLDPKLAAIAPQQCLFYASYAGFGPSETGTTNHTEKLMAEPQVQRLVGEVQRLVGEAIAKETAGDPKGQAAAKHVPTLIKGALASPMALYVEEVRPKANGEAPDIEGALVIRAGLRQADMEDAVKELIKLKAGDQTTPKVTLETTAGVEWAKPELPPDAPVVRLGKKGEYVIIAVGETTHTEVVERLDGEAPKWLANIRDEHRVEKEISLGYLNIKGILDRARPFIEADDPKAWSVIEKLGFTHVSSIHGVSGFDEVGVASFGHWETDGVHEGALALFPHLPLTKKDVARIPKDALFAFAMRLDPSETWDKAVELAMQFEPNAPAELQQGLDQLKAQTGIDVEGEIIRSLGDVWTIYAPGGDLMTGWFNSAAAVKVKDPDKLRGAIDKAVALGRIQMAQSGAKGSIIDSTVDGLKIYTVQSGQPMPISPSWCVSDEWLVAGLTPQAIRGLLDREQEYSLAANEIVVEALSVESGPAILAYQDTPQFVRSVYPFLLMGVGAASGELRKQGIMFDVASLPTLEVLVRHIRPSTTTFRVADDGFESETRCSLPGMSISSASGFMAGLLLPAVQAAREAARRNQSMNNLKMLSLGLLNYESAYGSYPAQASVDEKGKPLLSWRVHILPFLEDQDLYEQFHLDEPWDSEHNKTLIAQMPAVYLDPSSPLAAEEGKTLYLGVAGPGTLFGGDRVKMRDVTDGTSNSLTMIQVSPEAAEIWTKPADWELDAKNVKHSLGGPHPGGFLAAFGDGHVEMIPLTTSDDKLKAQATIAGGEIVPAQ